MMDCPDRQELQELITGRHAPDRQQFLERHLESCEGCRRRLEALADVRGVVPDRPLAGRRRLPESPALKNVVDQLGACADGPTGGRLPFLQPTDRPGYLGKIGTYEVRRLIGSGGTGMVFEGIDPVLKRTVAIKVLSPLLAVSDQARSRFLREAQAAAAL